MLPKACKFRFFLPFHFRASTKNFQFFAIFCNNKFLSTSPPSHHVKYFLDFSTLLVRSNIIMPIDQKIAMKNKRKIARNLAKMLICRRMCSRTADNIEHFLQCTETSKMLPFLCCSGFLQHENGIILKVLAKK